MYIFRIQNHFQPNSKQKTSAWRQRCLIFFGLRHTNLVKPTSNGGNHASRTSDWHFQLHRFGWRRQKNRTYFYELNGFEEEEEEKNYRRDLRSRQSFIFSFTFIRPAIMDQVMTYDWLTRISLAQKLSHKYTTIITYSDTKPSKLV